MKGKSKRGKDEEVNGQWGRGVPRPHTGHTTTPVSASHNENYGYTYVLQ